MTQTVELTPRQQYLIIDGLKRLQAEKARLLGSDDPQLVAWTRGLISEIQATINEVQSARAD